MVLTDTDVMDLTAYEFDEETLCDLSSTCWEPATWTLFCGACKTRAFCLCDLHRDRMVRGCITWVCAGCVCRKENGNIFFEPIS